MAERHRRHRHPGPDRHADRRRGASTCVATAPTTWCCDNTISDTGLRRDEVRRGRLHRHRGQQLVHLHRLRARPQRPQRRQGQPHLATTTAEADRHQGGHHRRRWSSDNTFDGSAHHRRRLLGRRQGQRLDWSRATAGPTSPTDGFQTHEILDGWGDSTSSSDNIADVDGAGLRRSPSGPRTATVVAATTTRHGAAERASATSTAR